MICPRHNVTHASGAMHDAVERQAPAPRRRRVATAPNERELLYMPCGCLALPVELVHKLGDNFQSFICDEHGEVKVTKAWKRKVKGSIPVVRIPSEFGYQTAIQETL